MVHVDSQNDKEKFIPENPEKYVASGLSVMKISNDESNLFYEYAAPKVGFTHLTLGRPRIVRSRSIRKLGPWSSLKVRN